MNTTIQPSQEPLGNILFYVNEGLAMATVIELGLFVRFIISVEAIQEGSLLKVLTPMTTILLVAVVSQIGLFASYGFCLIATRRTVEATLLWIFNYTCLGINETAYVFYTYNRSSGIVRLVFPKLCGLLKAAVYTAPLMLNLKTIVGVTCYIARIDPMSTYILLSLFVSFEGVYLIFLDTMFLVTFHRFLLRTRIDEEDKESKRFKIIATYGIASCILCYICFLVFGLASFFCKERDKDMIQAVVITCIYFTYNFIIVLLFSMKIDLHNCKVKGLGECAQQVVVGATTANQTVLEKTVPCTTHVFLSEK
ncbi:hypothetical protein BDR26DRAFT_857672 [Obelidium mucronatum]|nr:hypothetical protein BDR26DRAFT_857672 [Obelidium mucronatum]